MADAKQVPSQYANGGNNHLHHDDLATAEKPYPHDPEAADRYSIQHGETTHLERRLQSRHLQMIAIGGTIGTGLFIGTGGALQTSGPAGILIAFIFVGTLVYSVMVALGEMATYMPVPGSFTVYASRFVDRSLGFSMGWLYWFSWAITYALELTASGIIIQYWRPDLNIGIWIGVFFAVITAINFLPVSFYGEVEFWFAMIKVLTVVGFLIFGICIDAGAGQYGYVGFWTWHEPGAFAAYPNVAPDSLAKFVGFWSVLITAGFSYQGTELVGIAAGECANPRVAVPSAIKKTFWRILLFFIGSVFFIGLLVPYDNEDLGSGSDANASPFVIAAKIAGVPVLPGLINAVLLTVVLSAANSNVYSGSRILVGLANVGSAPKFFTKTTNGGVPYIAVATTAVFGLLAFLNEDPGRGTDAFGWFINISGVAGFIAWACITFSHIRFMGALKAQGISRDSLAYKAMWQPWFSWYGLFLMSLIIITQGFTAFIPWDTTKFFVAYISLIIFVVLYVGHKIITRCPIVPLTEIDLFTGVREIDDMSKEDFTTPPPTTWYGKMWNAIS